MEFEKKIEYKGSWLILSIIACVDHLRIEQKKCSEQFTSQKIVTSIKNLEHSIEQIQYTFCSYVDYLHEAERERLIRLEAIKIKEHLHKKIEKFYGEINCETVRINMIKSCVEGMEELMNIEAVSAYNLSRSKDSVDVIDIKINIC